MHACWAVGVERETNTDMIKVEVQLKPLSVNEAFQGHRYKTKDCKHWERCFQYMLPRKGKVKGMVRVHYRFFLKNHASTDYDNLIKIMQDNLVKAGYIDDDRKIYHALIEKIPTRGADRIEIEIRPYAFN